MITDAIYRTLGAAPAIQRQYGRVVRHLPHRLRIVQHFGQRLRIDPSELHGFYLYYEREYDDPIFQFLDARVRRYQRAIDLGANVGIYSVFLGARIPLVDAFEPDPAVLTMLHGNLKLNALINVTVHPLCVSREAGETRFQKAHENNRGLGRVVGEDGPDVEVVRTVSLDSFLGNPISVPTLIKMDVEGAEWLILQGCAESVGKRAAPVDIAMEIHPDDIRGLGGSVAELHAMLTRMGFTVEALGAAGLRPLAPDLSDRFWWASSAR